MMNSTNHPTAGSVEKPFVERRFFRSAISTVLLLIVVLLLGQVDFMLRPLYRIVSFIVVPFILAGIFYYLFRPVVRFLQTKRIPRTVSILGLYILGVALLVFFSIFAGQFLQTEFETFAGTFSKGLELMETANEQLLEREFFGIVPLDEIRQQVRPMMESTVTLLAGRFGDAVSAVVNVVLIVFLVPVVLFFLLKDETFFHEQVLRLSPARYRDHVAIMLQDVDRTFRKYIIGQFIIGVMMGLSTFIAYLVIGLPNALILGVFVTLTSFIPFLGPVLGLFPALLIAVTFGWLMILKVLLIFVVIEVLESNVYRPNVMGHTLQMHPLMVVFSVFTATYLFGIIGTFVAVPVYVAAREVGRRLLEIRNAPRNETADTPE